MMSRIALFSLDLVKAGEAGLTPYIGRRGRFDPLYWKIYSGAETLEYISGWGLVDTHCVEGLIFTPPDEDFRFRLGHFDTGAVMVGGYRDLATSYSWTSFFT